MQDLRATLVESGRTLANAVYDLIERQRANLDGSLASLQFFTPLRRVQTERQRVDELSRRELSAQAHRLDLEAARLKGLEEHLLALSPLAVLGRGYAVVTKAERVVVSRSQVREGDGIHVRVRDGEFDARVSGG